MSAVPGALSFRQALLAMCGVALSLMMSALDQTIIGNVLPSIVADLDGFALHTWVATGYLLASVISIPVFGRLGDLFGRKPFVLAAVLLFTGASLWCALAPSMGWLVAARTLQGLGGGILIGTAFACVPELFPDTAQRLRWQVLMSTAFSAVNAAGPSLGGWLTQAYGWRAVFCLQLPLGLLALYFVARHLPRVAPVSAAGAPRAKVDGVGVLLVALTLGSLQMAVQWWPGSAWSGRATGAALVFGLSLWALVQWERRVAHPLLPRSLFGHPDLRRIFLLSTLAGAMMFVLLFYLPLLLQGSYGYSPRQAGLLITPLALCITLGAIVNGRIVTRLANPNWLPMAGFALLATACGVLAALQLRASFGQLLALMFAAGLGLGFVLMNLTLFTQTLAPRSDLGIATALTQSLRLVGGMLGTATVGTMVSGQYQAAVGLTTEARQHPALAQQLADPRLLFGHASEASALDALRFAGPDPAALLHHLQTALCHAIGLGLGSLALLGLVALWLLRRTAAVRLA